MALGFACDSSKLREVARETEEKNSYDFPINSRRLYNFTGDTEHILGFFIGTG